MSDIINLNEHRPHLTGDAICVACKHKWIAFASIGEWWFECPICGTDNGLWVTPVDPPCERYECECGSQLFYIVHDGPWCRQCGRIVRF